MSTKQRVSKYLLIPILVGGLLTGCSNSEPISLTPKLEIPTEPKSFEDILNNPNSAIYWAWKKSQNQILNTAAPKAAIAPPTW